MSMNKAISNLLLTVLGLALLVYSAARSLNFIQATLPDDKQILAFFGLAALDLGLLLWLGFFLSAASGPWQRGVALLMVGVDLVGAIAMFTLDTLYESGQTGIINRLTPDEIRTSILGLSGVIAVNIAAVVFCHIMDPQARQKRAKEEAIDKITDKSLDKIGQSADLLAEQLSNDIAQAWQAEILATYTAALGKPKAIPAKASQDKATRSITIDNLSPDRLGDLVKALRSNGHGPAARVYESDSEDFLADQNQEESK